MVLRTVIIALALSLTSAACGDSSATVPNVVGQQLDEAKSMLERAGLEVETEGGGVFGVVDEAAWEVCRQEPEAGQKAGQVTLFVERECNGEAGQTDDEAEQVEDGLEGVEVQIKADRLDLYNRSENTYFDCRVDINPGFVRRGYDRMLPMEQFGPDDYIGLPYGSFTNRRNERFNIAERAVESILVACRVGDRTRTEIFRAPGQ